MRGQTKSSRRRCGVVERAFQAEEVTSLRREKRGGREFKGLQESQCGPARGGVSGAGPAERTLKILVPS